MGNYILTGFLALQDAIALSEYLSDNARSGKNDISNIVLCLLHRYYYCSVVKSTARAGVSVVIFLNTALQTDICTSL